MTLHLCCRERFCGPAGTAAGSSQQLLGPEESRRRELRGSPVGAELEKSPEERRDRTPGEQVEKKENKGRGWTTDYLASGHPVAQSWVSWQFLHLGVQTGGFQGSHFSPESILESCNDRLHPWNTCHSQVKMLKRQNSVQPPFNKQSREKQQLNCGYFTCIVNLCSHQLKENQRLYQLQVVKATQNKTSISTPVYVMNRQIYQLSINLWWTPAAVCQCLGIFRETESSQIPCMCSPV